MACTSPWPVVSLPAGAGLSSLTANQQASLTASLLVDRMITSLTLCC